MCTISPASRSSCFACPLHSLLLCAVPIHPPWRSCCKDVGRHPAVVVLQDPHAEQDRRLFAALEDLPNVWVIRVSVQAVPVKCEPWGRDASQHIPKDTIRAA